MISDRVRECQIRHGEGSACMLLIRMQNDFPVYVRTAESITSPEIKQAITDYLSATEDLFTGLLNQIDRIERSWFEEEPRIRQAQIQKPPV